MDTDTDMVMDTDMEMVMDTDTENLMLVMVDKQVMEMDTEISQFMEMDTEIMESQETLKDMDHTTRRSESFNNPH